MLNYVRSLKTLWAKQALEQREADEEEDGSAPIVWLLGVVALVISSAVLVPYFVVFNGPLSTTSADWANFGSYVGGLAGPLLALVSLAAFLITIRQQAYLAAAADRRAREDEHRRAINGYLEDLQRIEQMQVGPGQALGDLFSGAIDPSTLQDGSRLQALLRPFSETLFRYAEMVAMHRTNNRPLWDVTYYKNRGLRALRHLEPFNGMLNPLVLEAIRHHLEDSWPKFDEAP